MKHFRLFILPFCLLLSGAPQAALIIETAGITIGSNPGTYTATFHDFSSDQSYTSVFGTGGLLEGQDNDAITATQAEWSTVLDFIVADLGTVDHVDESEFATSDRFYLYALPTDIAFLAGTHSAFFDSSSTPGFDNTIFAPNAVDSTSLPHFIAFVTLSLDVGGSASVPSPTPFALLLSSLFLASAMGIRRRRS